MRRRPAFTRGGLAFPVHRALDQAGKRISHPVKAGALSQRTRFVARHHDSVGALRQARALERERLPQQPFDSVALYRSSHFARDREAQSRRALLAARKDIENEFTRAVRAPTPHYAIEVRTSRQPSPSRSGAGPGARGHHTVSRLRPLARRCLSVTRPARVRIRLRNPCARARLRFFG
jgi:hypothetical protein